MFTKQIAALIANMPVSACLINKPADIFYFTGIEIEGVALLVTEKDAYVLTNPMLETQARSIFKGFKAAASVNYVELLTGILSRSRIYQLGVDADFVSHAYWTKLSKHIKLQDISGLIAQIKQVKDQQEISLIRASCKIALDAAKYAKQIIKSGKTELEISLKIEEYFKKIGVKPAFPVIVASGPNSARPHHIPTHRKVLKNDVVLVDLGCVYKGYCSDLTRTYNLGKINTLYKQIYSCVDRAQKACIENLKAGILAKEADGFARNVIAASGFGDNFIHTTGHSLGVEIHESPRLSAKDETRLKPNMVVTVEPGIYIDGRFGVRIEDTVLINKKGCEVLTR
jgi:Xaa-Pro aminopeptidase